MDYVRLGRAGVKVSRLVFGYGLSGILAWAHGRGDR